MNDKLNFIQRMMSSTATVNNKPSAIQPQSAINGNFGVQTKPNDPRAMYMDNRFNYGENRPKMVNKDKIGAYLSYLESAGGKDPNTPGFNEKRSGIVPGANRNEKDRPFNYQVGFGGHYGLTPDSIADILKSTPDKNSPQNKYGYTGFTQSNTIQNIQEALLNQQKAEQLARDIFLARRTQKENYTPEAMARDYLDNYVTKKSKNYTTQNYNRALKYFTENAQ